MARLNICAWTWGVKYGVDYIQRLFSGVRRHLAQPYQTWMFTPSAEDAYLTEIPGCFARLRMFDPPWQASLGLEPGDRLVCLDLDLIITGPLDALFDRPEPYVILGGANAANPCPFNGSVQMLTVGAHPEVWTDFSLEAAAAVPHYAFPDDQAWIAHKLPNAATWRAGASTGVYAFKKPGWPKGDALPADASIVAFPGHRDPSKFTHLDWVKQHWR